MNVFIALKGSHFWFYIRGLKSLALYNLDTVKYMYTIWTKISKHLENIYQ